MSVGSLGNTWKEEKLFSNEEVMRGCIHDTKKTMENS